jgi:hypothetical protein
MDSKPIETLPTHECDHDADSVILELSGDELSFVAGGCAGNQRRHQPHQASRGDIPEPEPGSVDFDGDQSRGAAPGSRTTGVRSRLGWNIPRNNKAVDLGSLIQIPAERSLGRWVLQLCSAQALPFAVTPAYS